MKKIISLLLCAVLLTACAAAFADSASVDFRDRFQIRAALPDGYRLSVLDQNDLTLEGEIRSDDPAAPVMQLYISFNESYAAVNTLNDQPEAELEAIRQSFLEEYTASFDTLTSSSGIPMLVVRETGEAPDFLDFYTVFQGHEIELWLSKPMDAEDPSVSDAQIALWTDFARSLEIVSLQ